MSFNRKNGSLDVVVRESGNANRYGKSQHDAPMMQGAQPRYRRENGHVKEMDDTRRDRAEPLSASKLPMQKAGALPSALQR